MSKFFRLCSCELIKILKKTSTKVMLIILVVSLFASAGIAALTKKMYTFTDELTSQMDYKEVLKADLELAKAELKENEDALDEVSKNNLKVNINTYEIALDCDINIYNSYWKNEVLYGDITTNLVNYYNYKSLGMDDLAEKEQQLLLSKENLIKHDKFAEYIDLQKAELKQKYENNIIDEQEYKDESHILDLRAKYEIGKTYNPDDKWKTTILQEIQILQLNIRTGIDQVTQKALTEEGLKKASNNIVINEYRLEHDMPPFMTGDMSIGKTRKVYDYMVGSITMMVLAVMIIIIAGSSISSEISKGTIKFWTFTPNRRWKILFSKLLVNTFILIATTVVITLISTVIGNLFFGATDAQPYIYVNGGEAHQLHYIAFSILYNLAVAIDIFVFLLLAMMISTVARNTAVSVGVSIAAYLGGSTIVQILNIFIKSDWIKFIPFNNLGLADKIFVNDVSYSATAMVQSITTRTTVGFSLAVLGVTSLIMLVTMFDSFRKRDIK